MDEFLKEKIVELFKEQRFAVIATQGKTEPYTNLVSFLIGSDFKKIYFPTSKNTRKFKNLSENSRISILVDNRGNKPTDIENAMTVTAVGKTSVIKDGKIINDFLKKHPYLKEFVSSNDCAMIEIDIEKYIVVDNFEDVKIIDF
ncbi:MAG: pyridoxamine 5'-phosphate oxidase family protein [Candidatus Thermoplasmatota archaeon]|nr:pyridoxamine 5'-phosphate oxidase family protein [Candidatus Thermoplasmatota archaeon]